jgi:hypothetical protein
MLQLYEEDTRLELALQPLGIARMRWDGMVFREFAALCLDGLDGPR